MRGGRTGRYGIRVMQITTQNAQKSPSSEAGGAAVFPNRPEYDRA